MKEDCGKKLLRQVSALTLLLMLVVGMQAKTARKFTLNLTADGKLRPCLFSDREIDVRAALRNGGEEAVHECFLEALNLKPDDHHDKVGTERNMSQIGG